MSLVGSRPQSNAEIASALLRAERNLPPRGARLVDLVRLAAVACLAVGFLAGGVVTFLVVSVVAGAALWLSFRGDDVATERDLDVAFDAGTGLPLADAIDTVLADELVTRSLNGRLGIVVIDVAELATLRKGDERGITDAVMVSMIHRLQSRGWIDGATGAYGPLVFLRRPSVFVIVLRDVLDDRTTRWLAGRMLEALDRPVRWQGTEIEPGVALGLAVGSMADRDELLWRANDARRWARRQGSGSLVVATDSVVPMPTTPAAQTWLVDGRGGPLGRLFRPEVAGGEMFAELSAFLRSFDEAAEWVADAGHKAFVQVPPACMIHWGAPARITSRVNAAGLHGRLGIVIPVELAERAVGPVAENLEVIRRCGVDILVDHTPSRARSAGDTPEFDGVVVAAGDTDHAGAAVATVAAFAHDADPFPLVSRFIAGETGSLVEDALFSRGTDWPVRGGQSAQLAQVSVTPAR